MCECFACMYICVACACLVPSEVRRRHGFPGTGITNCCESFCWYWEPNLGLLKEQVLLNAKPSLQSLHTDFRANIFRFHLFALCFGSLTIVALADLGLAVLS